MHRGQVNLVLSMLSHYLTQCQLEIESSVIVIFENKIQCRYNSNPNEKMHLKCRLQISLGISVSNWPSFQSIWQLVYIQIRGHKTKKKWENCESQGIA